MRSQNASAGKSPAPSPSDAAGSDPALWAALDLSAALRAGHLSPADLVDRYLARIEALNDGLGAYWHLAADAARAEAREKAEVLASGVAPTSPLFGLPVAVKDLNAAAGLPQTLGIAALRDRRAEADDGVVQKLRAAGAIVLGTTATSQLGSLPYTEPEGFPPSRNPWNPERTPGGSSGGGAAAVAAGLCALAVGSDGGGSLRGPAFCCGIVGFKPSRGRVSNAPVGDYLGGIASHGPLARTVADAAALLDAIAGYVVGDPYWLPPPERSFLETVLEASREGAESRPAGLRVGVATAVWPGGPAADPQAAAVARAADLLAAAGHALVETELDATALADPFTAVWQAGAAMAAVPPDWLEPFNRWLLTRSPQGGPQGTGDYLRAVAQMQAIARGVVAQFYRDRWDVLLLPVYRHGPMRVGEWRDREPAEILARVTDWISPCPPFNATGQPALALPAGLDPEGLPLGVQLVGRPGDDATVLALAAQLEAAGLGDGLGRDRHPPLARLS